jgi:hypothetical protein
MVCNHVTIYLYESAREDMWLQWLHSYISKYLFIYKDLAVTKNVTRCNHAEGLKHGENFEEGVSNGQEEEGKSFRGNRAEG